MKLLTLLFLVISIQCLSQSPIKQASFTTRYESESKLKLDDIILKKDGNYVTGDKSRIPSAITESFSSRYTNASNISWFIADQYYTVSFNADGQTIFIKYNADGEVLFTKKIYAEEKLDPNILDLLKEEVSSLYKVKYITEVQKGETIDYNIELSNEKYWLIIKYNFNKTSGKTDLTGRHMFGQ